MVIAGLATAATVSLAFAGYASRFISAPSWLVAALLVVAAVGLNVVGVREASWANIAFTLIEAAGLVALVAVGARDPDFWGVFASSPHAGVLAGAGLIFFAYLGFEDIANLAEEARHPARDIPRAILIAVAVSTLLYVLVAAASVALLDPAALARSASPLADAIQAGAPRLAGALGGVALFATANTALITITVAGRMLFGMARGGDAPSRLAATLPGRQTPAAALLVAGIGALAFLPLGGVGLVGSVASLLALLAFAAVNVTVLRLRPTRPEAIRPFRVPIAVRSVPLLPIAGLFVVLALMTQFAPRADLIAFVAVAIAFAAQAVPWARDRGTR